ncbi:MAG: glycosyltransferase family 4 protein [Richelia sp. RM2_1_2]|nr:glycosyltransferase family 4 protein [Richelia sp. RM1_1_1]NJO64004.1 glycosyltransferase family 4 protein [Richelia sp. RM2_1_2]
MKVAFFTHYTSLYGANRSLLNLIDGLKLHNIVPFVIVPSEGDITDALKTRNVEFAIIPIQWWVGKRKFKINYFSNLYENTKHFRHGFKRLYKNLKVLPSLANQLREWNIDLVYTNASVIPQGALVSRRLNLPHIWHLREFIDLDYNFHHDWGKAIFNYFVSQADAQIAISKAIHSYFTKGISPARMHLVYNGIASLEEFDRLYQQQSSLTSDDKPYTFALVGIIHPNKGQETAIRALSLLVNTYPKIRLLIVGKGEITPLKKLTDELGILNQIEFWGHIDDPYKAYLASDAVLMCSKNEGMGRVTVEAMSACRPVIGYDNAGTSEIIKHEYTGLLYKGEHEALATCMRRFIDNPDWARKLGDNAWHIARNDYSIETYSKKIYEIMLSVVKTKSAIA